MPSPKISLDDHQKFTLMKFRRSVAEVLHSNHDDAFLLRWLRARSWNPEAAEKMLRQSLVWRQQWEVDGALKTWQPTESLVLFYPSGTSGFDADGAPIIVVPFAGLDIVGMLHANSRQDLIRLTIKVLEKNMEMAREKGESKVNVVFDMEGFNIKQYAWRPAAEVAISLIQMYEANYPEILKFCYIVNAPRVFAIAFNVVKRFLNEYTLGKIQIFKSDPKKWKKAILETIPAESLPVHFGGTLADPDGNPRYTTKVKQGGKVPESYYKRNFDQKPEDSDTPLTSVTVKKGDKLVLDFIAVEEGCFLRWDFRTEGHDIRFGITLKDAEDQTSTVVKHKRVASHQVDESGVIACQVPATYTVTFDNTYSMLRSKKLHYFVTIDPPIEKLGIVLPKDDEFDATADASVH